MQKNLNTLVSILIAVAFGMAISWMVSDWIWITTLAVAGLVMKASENQVACDLMELVCEGISSMSFKWVLLNCAFWMSIGVASSFGWVAVLCMWIAGGAILSTITMVELARR